MSNAEPSDDDARGQKPQPIDPTPAHAARIAEVRVLCDALIPRMPWMRRWRFEVMPVAPDDAPGGLRMYHWHYVKIAILAVQADGNPHKEPETSLLVDVGHELAHLLCADMRRCAENVVGEGDGRKTLMDFWTDAEETACWDFGYLIAELAA